MPILTVGRNTDACVFALLCVAAAVLGFASLSAGSPQTPRPVYEVRLYHVKDGMMSALKARFDDSTAAIFRRHNMMSIGYWSPEDAPDSQDLLICIIKHPSRQEAEKNWAALRADPEWQKVSKESDPNGPLVDHIDHYFADPTSFSALR